MLLHHRWWGGGRNRTNRGLWRWRWRGGGGGRGGLGRKRGWALLPNEGKDPGETTGIFVMFFSEHLRFISEDSSLCLIKECELLPLLRMKRMMMTTQRRRREKVRTIIVIDRSLVIKPKYMDSSLERVRYVCLTQIYWCSQHTPCIPNIWNTFLMFSCTALPHFVLRTASISWDMDSTRCRSVPQGCFLQLSSWLDVLWEVVQWFRYSD